MSAVNHQPDMKSAARPTSSNEAVDDSNAFIQRRLKELVETDSQIRAALPLDAINQAKNKPGLCLSQVVNICMEGYADRPALAVRATQLKTDPATGRSTRELLDRFEAISYRDLWSRAGALATFWHNEPERHLRAGEFVNVIAFAGIDYITVQLAAIYGGAVLVPLQTNGQMSQLQGIVEEVEPRWMATSLECLEKAVNLALNSYRPKGILLFDYDPKVDDHRETFEKQVARLEEAGLSGLVITLEDACRKGRKQTAIPFFVPNEPDNDKRLSSIIYTSGSTGLPKGAMTTEGMEKYAWLNVSSMPLFCMHYMPMNHSFGPASLGMTLGLGGTVYFTAKSDLSSLFEDMSLARPTYMGMVPRIAEMVHQQFKVELDKRAIEATDSVREEELLLEFRNKVLGGRFLSVLFASAPSTPELRHFMKRCLGFKLNEAYGATEIRGGTYNNRINRAAVDAYKLVDVPELGYFSTDKPYPRGELYIISKQHFLGYYKRPEVTAAVFDEEGFYKTGDIMAEIEPDHLIYVDRRNNVQKLSQGEFVAIALREATYTNGHPLIKQAFLYGSSDRSFLVGVFVPNADVVKSMGIAGNDKAIKAALRDAINEIARNEKLLAHEVPRDFIVEHEPFSTENGLLAGIGKYQRPKFKEKYSARLEALYDAIENSREDELHFLRKEGRNLPILETVGRAVQAVLGLEELDPAKRVSFIELGGDSLTALSCSLLLEEIFNTDVPASVINNPAGSLQQLAQYIERATNSAFAFATFTSVHGKGATQIRASDLTLDNFIDADTLKAAARLPGPSEKIRTVLVTGANGFLGRFLCLEWLERMARVGGKVICVVRGEDNAAAYRRLRDAIDSKDPKLMDHFDSLAARHLEVLAGDLGEPFLGLSQADWQRLAESVDHIVHPAALVNHVLPYAQLFGPNVVGTAELIRLALSHHIKPINNVSTMAVAPIPGGGVMTEDDDVRIATPVRTLDDSIYASGYANSKWAGEVLLREANDRFGLPVSIYRSDMILAHSKYKGQFNVPDMFTRWMLSTVLTGLAPGSYYEAVPGVEPHYDGLPVDFTAAAIATLGEQARQGYRCYHVVNPHEDGISMDTFIDWAIEAGYPINRVEDYNEWLKRFETALRALPDKQRQASSLPLVHQLRKRRRAPRGADVSAVRFRADVQKYEVGPDKDIPHLSREFIQKYFRDLYHIGLIEDSIKGTSR